MQDEDIADDTDNPMTTQADWDGAAIKMGDKVIGTVRGRGKQKKPTKIPTTLRLSPEVMAYFKATGEGWQTRVDAALREYIQDHPTH
ncbi:MAG: BrnA antitoxin family protein [Moraxellaceae bacterium]|nr:BrnA antitoxin family protein [Moraxellaceae bacterium]